MTPSEAKTFESDPLCDKYVALRRWDEQAKTQNQLLPALTKYKHMMTMHLLDTAITNQ
jgi:predicted HD phosphohydrolase